jgi:hypothetical protein
LRATVGKTAFAKPEHDTWSQTISSDTTNALKAWLTIRISLQVPPDDLICHSNIDADERERGKNEVEHE